METSKLLPNRLCNYCVTKVFDFIPFMKLCKESNQKWRRAVENLQLSQTTTKDVHIVLDNDLEKRDVLYCPKTKENTPSEALKVLKQRITRRRLYKRRTEKEKRLKAFKNPNLKCPECDKHFCTAYNFNKHLNNANKHMCPDCYIIMDLKEYKSHAEKNLLNVFLCDICLKCFEKKKYFLAHKKKHERGSHVCAYCKLTFSNFNKLISHVSSHKPCICTTCQKKFSNRSCYRIHAKDCLESKDRYSGKFVCDYCLIVCKRKATLKTHIRLMHLSGQKLQCDKCGKTFISRAHLEEHGNTHDKVANRYVCECGLKYSTRRGYQMHLQIHSCKKIDQVADLNRKKKVLPFISEFYCEKCGLSFSDVNFDNHLCGDQGNDLTMEPAMEIEVITIQ